MENYQVLVDDYYNLPRGKFQEMNPDELVDIDDIFLNLKFDTRRMRKLSMEEQKAIRAQEKEDRKSIIRGMREQYEEKERTRQKREWYAVRRQCE